MDVRDPDPEDREVDELLRRQLGELCQRSTCPPPETLVSYHSGGLTDEEPAEVSRHLKFCATCEAVLEMLDGPGDAAGPELLRAEQRLDERFHKFLNSKHQSGPARNRWLRWFWHPAPAAAG